MWEADRSEPRANKPVALAGILNVSPTYLLSGLGQPAHQPTKHQKMIEDLNRDIEHLEQSLRAAGKIIARVKSHAKKIEIILKSI